LRTALLSKRACPDIRWQTLEIEESNRLLQTIDSIPPRLTIVAVSTPDPETVLWEDYSRKWAIRLGMDQSRQSPCEHPDVPLPIGPRYLLPANDLSWAVHEIQAAVDAMDCTVEIASPFA
jgi:hypothetical protein